LLETNKQREQAVKYLDEAAAFYSNAKDFSAAAHTLVKAGESFYDKPDRGHRLPTEEERQADLLRTREGVKRFEEALKNFELKHDGPNIIEMLTKISEFYGNFKNDADRRKALAAYEKLSHYASIDPEPEPLMKTAQLYFAVNEPARADEYLSKKVKLHRDAAEVNEAVGTLVRAGEFLAEELKDKERAVAYFERALKLCHEICEKQDEANMLISVGEQVDSLVGDERAAVGYFEKAAQIHRERGDKEAEAQALTAISKTFQDRCELDLQDSAAQPNPKAKCEMAIQYLKRALAIHQEAGDLEQQSITVSNIADVYEKLGETQLALETRRAALALAPASNVAQRAAILGQIAKAQSAADENSRALETYKEILALQETKGAEQEQANALKEIGDLQFKKLKQPQEAVASYQRALLLYDRSHGKPSFESVVQEALHRAYVETKRQKSQ
jgi:tetratricopeptide (TPR) repeat protein